MIFLKKYISFEVKIRLLLLLQKFKKNHFSKEYFFSSSDEKIIIFLAADYSNLGDVAITYAQNQFINTHTKNAKIIEIPISRTIEGITYVKSILNSNDKITLIGGGNFGDAYAQIESLRQLVILNFPNNKIISFPQTIDFSNTPKGKKALQKAVKIYSQNKKLYFFVREEKSLQLMQEHFKDVKIDLIPDIVLSLDKTMPKSIRKGVTLSLRSDMERLLNESQNQELLKWVYKKFEDITVYDTHIDKGTLSVNQREEELHKIWDQYRVSEIVITDRLHGMIFSYITNTPVIVFLNNNHKIEFSYLWISSASNCCLMKKMDIHQMDQFVNELNEVQYVSLTKYYEPLIKALQN